MARIERLTIHACREVCIRVPCLLNGKTAGEANGIRAADRVVKVAAATDKPGIAALNGFSSDGAVLYTVSEDGHVTHEALSAHAGCRRPRGARSVRDF